MKQKNLVLMVVAVGCGLVAAFLTSQMSGKPKIDTTFVDVIVAQKEIKPGTRFTKDSLKDQVKRKPYKQNEVPQNACTNEEELIDKQITRVLRADDYIGLGDLGTYKPIDPPAGKHLMTIRLPLDKVTPFVKAGSTIDLMGTIISRAGIVKGSILIPNMLVMAVDLQTRAPNEGQTGTLNIQVITLAVNGDEALLIRQAEKANVEMSFVLLSETDQPSPATKNWSKDAVMKWINDAINGENTPAGASPANTPPVTTTAERPMIKVPVPRENLPAGTELTAEILDTKFKEVEFAGPAPDNVVVNIRESVGKYLTSNVYANLFIPKDCIGNKPNEAPKAKPKPVEEKKYEEFDRNYTGPSGTKVYRFRKDDKGEWKLYGEVNADGTVTPVPGGTSTVPPKAVEPKGDEPKVDPKDPKAA